MPGAFSTCVSSLVCIVIDEALLKVVGAADVVATRSLAAQYVSVKHELNRKPRRVAEVYFRGMVGTG